MKNISVIIATLIIFSFLVGCKTESDPNSGSKNSVKNDTEFVSNENGAGASDANEASEPTKPAGEKNQGLVNLKVDESEDNYLTLRSAPDTKTGKRIAKLPAGAFVKISKCQTEKKKAGGKSGNWCEVSYGDNTGWVFDAFLIRFSELNTAITAQSVGDVRIDASVGEAKKAMKGTTFKRTADGEGIVLIGVMLGDVELMSIYAGEEDGNSKVADNAKIEQITVWNRNFKTSKGVHPIMKVVDAEKHYGSVKEIMISEIESREWITFTNHPKGLGFRMYGGVYKDGENKTTEFKSDTTIHSITVDGR